MAETTRTWSEDWSKRVYTRLREIGYGSVEEYLNEFPGESYFKAADRIADWVAAMQVQRLQMEESKRSGRILHAAMDSLAREFCEVYPNGYGGDVLSSNAAALGRWTSTLEVHGLLRNSQQLAVELAKKLLADPPPTGWKPKSLDDEIISRLLKDIDWASLAK